MPPKSTTPAPGDLVQLKNKGIRHVAQLRNAKDQLTTVNINGGDTVQIESCMAAKLIADYPDDFELVGTDRPEKVDDKTDPAKTDPAKTDAAGGQGQAANIGGAGGQGGTGGTR